MTEAVLADLLPWVIGFFALDGFVQLGRGHLLAAGGGALHLLRPGVHWLGFSPAAEAVALFDLPFLRAGGRLWIVDPKRRSDPTLLEAQDLTPVDLAAAGPLDRTHKGVSAGATLLFNAPTTALAARLMAELAAGPPAGKAGRAGRAARADLRAARALRLRLRPYRITLQVLAWVLGALLLVVGPLAIWSPLSRYPLATLILRETGVLLLAVAAVGGAYLRAAGESWGRSIGGALGLLLPWAALHPLTHLSRAVYRRFDAPTALAALLPAAGFHAYAARELVRVRLSRERTPPELGPAWDEREQLLSRLLTATGSSPAQALAPPAAEPDEAAYCPVCRTVYREGVERCADCDLALVALR